MVQQLEGMAAQVVEEEARLTHLQEEADAKREEQAAAQKHALSARTSLLVLEEKYHDAQAALQELSSELCEVWWLCFVSCAFSLPSCSPVMFTSTFLFYADVDRTGTL